MKWLFDAYKLNPQQYENRDRTPELWLNIIV